VLSTQNPLILCFKVTHRPRSVIFSFQLQQLMMRASIRKIV